VKNPQAAPRGIRVYTDAEIKKLAEELGTTYGPMIRLAAATGLRPDEWARLERRDVDKRRRVLSVRGTKAARSRREVPLTRAALDAVEVLPARIDTPHLFPNADGGPLNPKGFGRREWGRTMIEAHYGALLDTAHDAILERLDAANPHES
jgi:integrase